jgi:WD40 repeat protein
MDASRPSGAPSRPRRLLNGCLVVVAAPLLVWCSLWLLLNPLHHSWPVGPEDPLPLSPDGQFYAVSSGRTQTKHIGKYNLSGHTTLELRHIENNTLVGTFPAWAVNTITVSADHRLLATSSWDQTVQVWQVRDGVSLHTWQQAPFLSPQQIEGLAFSPNGQLVASGGDDGTVQLRRVSDGTQLHTFREQGRVSEVAFSPDSRFLAYSLADNTVALIRRVDDGTVVRSVSIGRLGNATSVAFSPDGQFLAVGVQVDTGGQVQVWRTVGSDPQPEHTFYTLDWVFAVAFSPDGQLLAAGGGVSGSGSPLGDWQILPPRKPITIWRVGDDWSDRPAQTISSPQGHIKDLAFTSDSQRLVSSGGYAGGGGSVAVFQVAPGSALWGWLVPVSAVAALVWVVWRWRRRP